jgi:hypothetical protein
MLTGDQSRAESSARRGPSVRERLVFVTLSTLLAGLWLGGYDWLRPERYRSLLVGLMSGLIMGMYWFAPRFGWVDRLFQPGTDYSAASTWRWPGVGVRRLYEMVIVVAGVHTLVVWLIKGELPSPFTLLFVPMLCAAISLGIRIQLRKKGG